MKGRNDDRYWYDMGYGDGCRDTRRDSKIPLIIGVSCLSALLAFDQIWAIAFVIIWAAFELQEWYDLKEHHESDPPEMWEHNE